MYSKYIELKKQLQLKGLSIDDMLKLYQKKINEIDESNELRKYYIWDCELLACNEQDMILDRVTNKRLTPYLYSNSIKYTDIENFEDERVKFYSVCLQNEENIKFKLRYLNYLVDYGEEKYNYAKQLVQLTLKNNRIKHCDDVDECSDYISMLSRLMDILMRFNINDKFSELEDNITSTLNLFDSKNNYRWVLEISELLRYLHKNKKGNALSSSIIKEVQHMLEKGREQYKSEKKMNFHIQFCNELYEWIRKEANNESRVNELMLEIGQAYEDESEYQGGRTDKSYYVKAHFLEKAARHYANIGECEKLDEIKSRLKEAYRLSKDENTEHKFEFEIPNDLIEQEVNKFILEDITNSFELFSRVGYFTPKINDIRDSAKSRQENSILNLVGITKIARDKKVFEACNYRQREKYFICQEYSIALQVRFFILYDRIWNRLLKQGLTVDMVIHRITDWEYMSEDNSVMIEKGIERYFEEDYISAIHILVPRFESTFRDFFSIAGLPTTSLKTASIQHEQTFNDFINNSFVEKLIDEDLLFLIKYIMLDDLGYNLRNKVAHGLAEEHVFNKMIADMIIYLFFCLTNYELQDQNGNHIWSI